MIVTIRQLRTSVCLCLGVAFFACNGDGTGPLPITIGPDGGVLTFANGNVTLVFPSGAVAEETVVDVVPTTSFPNNPTLVTGTAFDFRPDGLQFLSPVALTIRYEDANVPTGVNEGDLRLFRAAGNTWNQVSGSNPNTSENVVTGPITSFSVYAVLATETNAPVASVTVIPATASVEVNGIVQLTAELRDTQGNLLEGREIAWSSETPDFASVDEDGLVTGRAAGTTMITATSEGQSGSAELTVSGVTTAIALAPIVDGLANPVYLTAPPGDNDRVFIVEKGGVISIVKDGQQLAEPFLDISNLVSNGSEQGLLSMAFHPAYAENGRFYVYYTDTGGDTEVVQYTVTADPDVADPASASPIISVEQPFSNHNGGLLLFGSDGMLYIGLGDGGSAGDPQDHGQNLGTLLGTILRIDVDGGTPYAIPSDNPFVADPNALDEIWAYGLRNPWRYALDPVDNVIYIADVGQNAWEEVNAQAADAGGLNYGWNIMEASTCFVSDPCDQTGLVLPAVEYGHNPECSVTGGFVYRGGAMPSLRGRYFYSDYCAGWIRSFRFDGGQVTEETEWLPDVGNVLSFGQDALGELYVLTDDGRVRKIVPSGN